MHHAPDSKYYACCVRVTCAPVQPLCRTCNEWAGLAPPGVGPAGSFAEWAGLAPLGVGPAGSCALVLVACGGDFGSGCGFGGGGGTVLILVLVLVLVLFLVLFCKCKRRCVRKWPQAQIKTQSQSESHTQLVAFAMVPMVQWSNGDDGGSGRGSGS